MSRFKQTNYNQDLMIVLNLEEQLKPGSFEYALHHIIESRYDNSFLADEFNNEKTGRIAYPPKILLKIFLYCYANGILSSRKIERTCHNDIILRALTSDLKPDHSTIAAFPKKLGSKLAEVFSEILLICHEEELLDGTRFALDGLKLPSNASKEYSGTFQHLKKKRNKFIRKAKALMNEHKKRDQRVRKGKPEEAPNTLSPSEKLLAAADKIGKFLEKSDPKTGVTGKEVQSNITDNDSVKMHTSKGTVQGYNAQALVDEKHQVICEAQASGQGQDSNLLGEILEGAQETINKSGIGESFYKEKTLLVDSSYHSEKNLKAAEAFNIDTIAPDPNFRSRDQRFQDREHYKAKLRKKKTLFSLKDFRYDEGKDCYTCPNGKTLHLETKHSENQKGDVYSRYKTKKDVCQNCELKQHCLSKNGKNRSLNLPHESNNSKLCAKMRNRIDSPEAKEEYSKRMGIVEPVFANIRYNKSMNRFTYRGKQKVNWQWKLFCLVHNIEKIAHFGKSFKKVA